MELITFVLEKSLYPLKQVVSPDSQIYWPYLLSSLCIALLIFSLGFKDSAEKNMLKYLFPPKVFLHRSAILDYQNYLPIMLAKSFLVIPITALLSATAIANLVSHALSYLTSISTLFPISHPPLWYHLSFSLFLILAIDFGYFYNHYLRHKVPLLWEFHKIHHTAEVLTPFTLYRHHPLDYLVQILSVSLCAGTATGIWTFLFGSQAQVLSLNGVPWLLFAFYLTGNFRHSHIWVAFPNWASYVLMSPAQHYIHHANDSRYYDTNYGKILSLWDWMFGTLYIPQGYQELPLGLPDEEDNRFDTVMSFYFKPFRLAFRRLKAQSGLSLPNQNTGTSES
ncbi:MAG: sterol desaturase family protein [Synechococcales bacterium]|nr:sterol desaturase family protein [Synechococcales bacterium]